MSRATPHNLGNLRYRAQQRLRERKEAQNLPLRDPERLVYELEVHQVELEIQNEELREARVELESALARYTEIFDFAPIGYVTITLDGTIREINHAAARLLGAARAQLSGENIARLVTTSYKQAFADLLHQVLTDEDRGSCEVELLWLHGQVYRVHLVAALLARAEPLILLTVRELSSRSLVGQSPAESGMVPAAPASAQGTQRR